MGKGVVDGERTDGGVNVCQSFVAAGHFAACEDTLAIVWCIWGKSGIMLKIPGDQV